MGGSDKYNNDNIESYKFMEWIFNQLKRLLEFHKRKYLMIKQDYNLKLLVKINRKTCSN